MTKGNLPNKIEAQTVLREKGLKVTPSRLSVLSLFSEKCNPLSSEQIYKKLSSQVDLVTVYRTTASFEKKDILRRVDLHKDAVYFELNSNHHHHHIVCTRCGVVEKFEKCAADSFIKNVSARSENFTEIRSHSLEFFGVCNSCAKKGGL